MMMDTDQKEFWDAHIQPMADQYDKLWERAEALAKELEPAGLSSFAWAQVDGDFQEELLEIVDTKTPDDWAGDFESGMTEVIGLSLEQVQELHAIVADRTKIKEAIEQAMQDPVGQVLMCVMIGATDPAWSSRLLERDTEDDIAEAERQGLIAIEKPSVN